MVTATNTGRPTDATTTSAFSKGETEARADRSKVRWLLDQLHEYEVLHSYQCCMISGIPTCIPTAGFDEPQKSRSYVEM